LENEFSRNAFFFEKYLTQLKSESGAMSEEDFIQNFIINGGKEIELNYRE